MSEIEEEFEREMLEKNRSEQEDGEFAQKESVKRAVGKNKKIRKRGNPKEIAQKGENPKEQKRAN